VIRSANKGEIEHLKGKQICTYCRNGYSGNIAAAGLNKKGFTAVTLDGGFESWKNDQ
jgi:rhodanese-related sulfurtransferase